MAVLPPPEEDSASCVASEAVRQALRSHLQDVCGNEARQQVVEGPVRVQQLQRRDAQPSRSCRKVCGCDLRLGHEIATLVQKPAVWKCDAEAGRPQLAALNDNATS